VKREGKFLLNFILSNRIHGVSSQDTVVLFGYVVCLWRAQVESFAVLMESTSGELRRAYGEHKWRASPHCHDIRDTFNFTCDFNIGYNISCRNV
jgi:hypothetical protein